MRVNGNFSEVSEGADEEDAAGSIEGNAKLMSRLEAPGAGPVGDGNAARDEEAEAKPEEVRGACCELEGAALERGTCEAYPSVTSNGTESPPCIRA